MMLRSLNKFMMFFLLFYLIFKVFINMQIRYFTYLTQKDKHVSKVYFDTNFSALLVSEYDQENPQSKTANKPLVTTRKSHITIMRHQ